MFDDQDYYSQRAEVERQLAEAAQDPRAAHAHRKLAELHDQAGRRYRPDTKEASIPMPLPQRL
jgi:hypothetical protein